MYLTPNRCDHMRDDPSKNASPRAEPDCANSRTDRGCINQNGSLSREGAAAALPASDIFLDLSNYRAFGRRAPEGTACGCVPVLPQLGGADEFARGLGYIVTGRQDLSYDAKCCDKEFARIHSGKSGVYGVCGLLEMLARLARSDG
jgi:hypothetical protein